MAEEKPLQVGNWLLAQGSQSPSGDRFLSLLCPRPSFQPSVLEGEEGERGQPPSTLGTQESSLRKPCTCSPRCLSISSHPGTTDGVSAGGPDPSPRARPPAGASPATLPQLQPLYHRVSHEAAPLLSRAFDSRAVCRNEIFVVASAIFPYSLAQGLQKACHALGGFLGNPVTAEHGISHSGSGGGR